MMINITTNQIFLKIKKIMINDFEFLPSNPWKQKELLTEEFKSLGFYLTDHPLNEYEEVFNQLNIVSYSKFYGNDKNEGVVAGI